MAFNSMYAGPSNPSQDISANDIAHMSYNANDLPMPSMTQTLLTPINELQSMAQALFQSISVTQRTNAAPPISAFLAIDASLASAVKQAREHQVKQRKIERLKDEVLELERRWRDIVSELEEGRRDLEETVAEGEERRKGIEAAKAGEYSIPIALSSRSRIVP